MGGRKDIYMGTSLSDPQSYRISAPPSLYPHIATIESNVLIIADLTYLTDIAKDGDPPLPVPEIVIVALIAGLLAAVGAIKYRRK